ncbi:MAG: hypothetical protein ACK44M_00130 [Chloroflexus sp.]
MISEITSPPLAPSPITRPHLLDGTPERGAGEQRRLSLIATPAGYGKTTPAATWAVQCSCPIV